MAERAVVIASAQGLHARPAKLFAELAARQPVTVYVHKDDRPGVPATSLLGLMTLGATQGTEVVLRAEGDGAGEAVDALAELLSRDLDATEA